MMDALEFKARVASRLASHISDPLQGLFGSVIASVVFDKLADSLMTLDDEDLLDILQDLLTSTSRKGDQHGKPMAT